jgi:GNAT superfamily N-acetyltransferase
MSAAPIVVRPARPEEVIDLRHRILRHGLPRETAVFPGDKDPTTRHFVATANAGTRCRHLIIGCVTLVLNQWDGRPAWQLRGMAVAAEARGAGVGRALLEAAERFVASAQSPTALLWCNARVPAAGFYQRHGWRTESEVFDIPTAGPHVRMTKVTGA